MIMQIFNVVLLHTAEQLRELFVKLLYEYIESYLTLCTFGLVVGMTKSLRTRGQRNIVSRESSMLTYLVIVGERGRESIFII